MAPSDFNRILLTGASLAAFTLTAPAMAAETRVHRIHANPVLGTSFDMAVTSASEAEARFAFAAAQAEIARLDKVLSGWRTDSELAALNTAGAHTASPDLFAVLAACEAWRVKTDGAFNAGLGKVDALWSGEAAPDAGDACATARNALPLTLDRAGRTVVRPAGTVITPDGLAKGYILDQALAAARRAAPCAPGMMINIGGDAVCFGQGERGAAWTFGVADPAHQADNAVPALAVRLSGKAMAVSGPGQRDRLIDGVAYSHLLDARTGQPAARQQVAAIAARAVDADAAATALAALPADAALALGERLPGVEAAIFAPDGRTLFTSGWARNAIDCQAAPLPAGFKVEVAYEIPKIAAANYKNPFIVVWVTDADKNLVKMLGVVATRKNWIDSEYVWWRRYGRQDPALFESNLKPTKPPGKYTLEWDGTDAAGKRVGQGEYIIHIEAAREHGGHAYQQIPVSLGGKAVTANLSGKDELGTAQVRYIKR